MRLYRPPRLSETLVADWGGSVMRALFQEMHIDDNQDEDEYGRPRSPLGSSFPWQFVNGPLVSQPPAPSLAERKSLMQDRNLPRFLFRCFTDSSGGALLRRFNKRLNMADRVIPHFFLDHEDGIPQMTLDEYIARYPDHMQQHLVGSREILSPFSSWTPSIMAAYLFAGFANDPSARIAVVDTTLIHNELYCVDHYSLRGPPVTRVHNRDLPWEYHIYGPVMGRGFFTVPASQIADLWKVPPRMRSAPLSTEDITNSRRIAELFVSPAWGAEDADVIMQLTTNWIAGWSWTRSRDTAGPGRANLTEQEIESVLEVLRPELQDRANRKTVPLLPGDIYTSVYGFEWIHWSFVLLRIMEQITQ
ncbi:hypothetical protein N8I77_002446 [Diaporthe amygdali]|uniref:Uncharacterized protein n=1 Tax=Phomopsis amygdali TaxID=1214568 RepID=A0AAD9SSP3_PHOAM|nr:hypothetical protein N8I77_002446 [Diaporthe amygdali]